MALIPAQRIFHHVTAKPTRVVSLLSDHFRLGEERIQELLPLGCIYLNKRRVFSDCPLLKGAYLRLHLHPKRFEVSSIDWASRVVFVSNDYVVINKPAGIPTHASVDNAVENCLFQMRKVLNSELYVTQRLDNPVSGVLVFAKSKKSQAAFNKWLSDRKVNKIYRALVENSPPLGKHTHYMEPSERSPKTLSVDPRPHWLVCELTLTKAVPVKVHGRDLFEVEVELHTGRTHQIRAQLAALGSPIVGDKLYGSSFKSAKTSQIGLMAVQVGWPSSEKVGLTEDAIKAIWNQLG